MIGIELEEIKIELKEDRSKIEQIAIEINRIDA